MVNTEIRNTMNTTHSARRFTVKTARNFTVGTKLTGSVSQFVDGPRLIVWTANGRDYHGLLTEKLVNLVEDAG